MIDGHLFSFGTFPLIILDLKYFFMAKTSHYQFDSNRIQAGFLLTGVRPKINRNQLLSFSFRCIILIHKNM
jgi:hypothetical protein